MPLCDCTGHRAIVSLLSSSRLLHDLLLCLYSRSPDLVLGIIYCLSLAYLNESLGQSSSGTSICKSSATYADARVNIQLQSSNEAAMVLVVAWCELRGRQ